MIIDMELPSFPPTRAPSPPAVNGITTNGHIDDLTSPRGREGKAANGPAEVHEPVAQTGLGNLMKSAKKDVVVPEFDMSSFF